MSAIAAASGAETEQQSVGVKCVTIYAYREYEQHCYHLSNDLEAAYCANNLISRGFKICFPA